MSDVLRRFLRTRSFAFALVLSIVLLVANIVGAAELRQPEQLRHEPHAVRAVRARRHRRDARDPERRRRASTCPSASTPGSSSNVLILYLLPHGALGQRLGSGADRDRARRRDRARERASVAVLRYQPVIATLCMLFVLQGINQKIAGAPTASPPSWTQHLAEGFGPIPGGLVLIAVPVVAWLLLRVSRTTASCSRSAATTRPPTRPASTSRACGSWRTRSAALFAAVAGIAIATLLQSSDGNAGSSTSSSRSPPSRSVARRSAAAAAACSARSSGASAIFLVQNLLSALHVDAYWLQVAYGGMLIVGSVIGAQLTAPRRAGAA